jgi:hypothetical protein
MSKQEIDPFSVVASLQAGPPGRVRVGFNLPFFKAAGALLSGFRWRRRPVPYQSSATLEIDRAKLQHLDFSQQELAAIGFSFASRLCAVERFRSRFGEAPHQV